MADAATLTARVEDLPQLEGRTFGPSNWREMTQQEIDLFAQVTGDHNPIHVDPDFAAKTPYGTTIAHGLLTLSLVVPMMGDVFKITGQSMGVNYGLNRVRFPAPVPVGSRIRITGTLASVTEVTGGWQTEVDVTWEIEGAEKPACVAQLVLRYFR